MDNVIIIDIGNTSTKISLCSIKREIILDQVIEYNVKIKSSKKIRDFLLNNEYCEIVIGSVNEDIKKQLLKVFKKMNLKKVIINLTQGMFEPIYKNVKEKKENIGIDILSLSYYIGKKYNSGVGICSGTAIFVTVVENQIIKGVSIAPSLRRSFASISENAYMIDNFEVSKVNKGFGLDTNEAISSAYFHMVNGFITSVINQAKKEIKFNKLVLTGGNDIFQKEIDQIKGIEYLYDNKQIITIGYLLVYKNNVKKN